MALYALLVGITRYKKEGIPPLYGPTRDVARIQTYLQSRYQPAELYIKTIVDQEATKDNIVHAFRSHLGQAGTNDHLLFYFSGHGAEEMVHSSLKHLEQKLSFQTLVCYDSMSDTLASTLADKELRYLIRERSVTCPNIVTIMDCCHAGEATRNAELILKRLSVNVPARLWDQFVFADSITEAQATTATDMDDLLPQGTHIQLAACEARQSAWEVRKAGIFTSGLLEVLENTQSNISYYDLYSRAKYLLHKRFDQVPTLYIKADDKPSYGHQFFLGTTLTTAKTTNANISYNNSFKTWLLDKGAIQGVRTQDDFTLPVWKTDEQQPVTQARIVSTQPDHAIVEMQDDMLATGTYATKLTGLYQQPLQIMFEGEKVGIDCWENFCTKNQSLLEQEHISVTTEQAQADYVLLATGNEYLIIRSAEFDATGKLPPQPVVQQVRGYDESTARQVLSYLISIGRWEFCRQLQHPDTGIDPFPIQSTIQFDTDDKGHYTPAEEKNGVIEARYLPLPAGPSLKLTYQLKNTAVIPYYCAALFLDISYKIHPGYVPGEVIYLQPQQTQWLVNSKGLRFSQETFTLDYNRPYEWYYFLLIVSTDRFEISSLRQEALPLPLFPDAAPRSVTRSASALARGASIVDTKVESDWCTQLLSFRFDNPLYKKPTTS